MRSTLFGPARGRHSARRRVLLLVLLLVLLCALVLLALTLRRGAAQVRVSVGGADYTFAVSGEHLTVKAPVAEIPTVRMLCTRTVYTFPVKQGRTHLGDVTLTVDLTDDGAVYYVSSDVPQPVTLTLETPADPSALTQHSIRPTDTAISSDGQPVQPDTACDPDASFFWDGETTHLYCSRLAQLMSLGNTVYVRAVPEAGVTLGRGTTDSWRLAVPLDTADGNLCVAAGAITEAGLDFSSETVRTTLQKTDAGDWDYHLLSDGPYQEMPSTYSPRQDETSPHIYRSAAAWLLGLYVAEAEQPLFSALGKSILYAYLDQVNDTGFLPTQPTSQWLLQDYSIGGGFYDTRFNFDTIDRLLQADAIWKDPEIAQTILDMASHYVAFADENRFLADGLFFVPDYGGDATPSKALCSLNHYLTEGLTLIRIDEAYGSGTAEAGYEILDNLEQSADRWLRPSGDLWYAIGQDGVMQRDDYVSVTYNDLVEASNLLEAWGVWDNYPGLHKLLSSKEAWLVAQGHDNLLLNHAAC